MLIFTVLIFLIFKFLIFILLLRNILLDFTRHCEYNRLNKFLFIHRNLIMMISIKALSYVATQIKQTNISIFSSIFGLTVSFADPL